MKILSIGNSFSQDAHRWLYDICKSAGKEIYNANLYIGGCTLYNHWNKFLSNEAAYEYQIKGETVKMISLKEALSAEKWDIVTFQQASGHSGRYDTYEPFLSDLYREVRLACQNAKFYFHRTWAYETDFESEAFAFYNNDQHYMYEAICDASKKAAESSKFQIIPSGDVIQYLRDNTNEFDCKNGGLSLCRDGFHLSYIYGRFAAALTWYCTLFGGKAADIDFVPKLEGETTDERLINIIKNAVDTVIEGK